MLASTPSDQEACCTATSTVKQTLAACRRSGEYTHLALDHAAASRNDIVQLVHVLIEKDQFYPARYRRH